MVEVYAEGIVVEAVEKPLAAEIKHLQSFAKKYARRGHVDYVKQCLSEWEERAEKLGGSIEEKVKKDIMLLALDRGVKRQLKNAELYNDDNSIRDGSLVKAEHFASELLVNQRKLEDIDFGFAGKIAYRLRYGDASKKELQKKFDREGKIYDPKVLSEYKSLSSYIEKTKKKLAVDNPSQSMGLFGRFRKKNDARVDVKPAPEVRVDESKLVPAKDIVTLARQMSSEIYKSSPSTMLELSYNWAQEDAEKGDVASAIANIENVKKYSAEFGNVVKAEELQRILCTSYRNGFEALIKKAKRHAQKGMFSKARAEVGEARDYASKINYSILSEETDGILKMAYTNGLYKMLDKSFKDG